MSMTDENPIWSEKYRPKTIDDAILPDDIKKSFRQYRDSGTIPNLLLSGPAGCGKTTSAKALLNEVGADYIMINGSLDRNIDTLRNEIMGFASTMSFTGTRKFVIIDEADGLNPDSTMKALRGFMEEFSKNCGFILTCNLKSRIIEPLQSRCSAIDFTMPGFQSNAGTKLASQIHKRVIKIIETEEVEYDPKVVALLVSKYYPDFRRLINEIQRAASYGKITSETLSVDIRGPMEELVELVKNKKFTEMRTWITTNSDINSTQIFRQFYDRAYDWVEPHDIPNLVLLIGDYSYKHAFVADHEINLAAFLTSVMAEITFK